MILTPIDPAALPHVLQVFDAGLTHVRFAREVFHRIASTHRFPHDLHAGRDKAIALAAQFGIPTIDEEPAAAFSWDGHAIRTRSETSVVFHEIAHWQIAPAERRKLYDFGLGAGPETGRIEEANATACVGNDVKEDEENLASLLGILWEVEHDEPAILAFAEQNWLEFYGRPSTHDHFIEYLAKLRARGLVDDDGRPIWV